MLESCNHHARGGHSPRHQRDPLQAKVDSNSGQSRSGPQSQHPGKHIRSPGQLVKTSTLISKAVHSQITPANHTKHLKLGRGDTAYLQSGPQPKHFRKSAVTPGHWEEETMLNFKAVPIHSFPGTGREYRTLGRGDAAYFQSGPHPQQFRQPAGTLCNGIHRSTASLDATRETPQPFGFNMKITPWYQEVTGNDPPDVTRGSGSSDLIW